MKEAPRVLRSQRTLYVPNLASQSLNPESRTLSSLSQILTVKLYASQKPVTTHPATAARLPWSAPLAVSETHTLHPPPNRLHRLERQIAHEADTKQFPDGPEFRIEALRLTFFGSQDLGIREVWGNSVLLTWSLVLLADWV